MTIMISINMLLCETLFITVICRMPQNFSNSVSDMFFSDMFLVTSPIVTQTRVIYICRIFGKIDEIVFHILYH